PAVDVDRRVHDGHGVLVAAGQRQDGLGVLAEARTTPADASVQELPADARVEAYRPGYLGDVGADLLRQSGELVDEADLGGEERVGRVLGELGTGRRSRDQRR